MPPGVRLRRRIGPAYATRQNSPRKPRLSKIACVSFAFGFRQSARIRPGYHASESSQHCAMVRTAPRRTPRAAHQRSTSASDRKPSIVDHV